MKILLIVTFFISVNSCSQQGSVQETKKEKTDSLAFPQYDLFKSEALAIMNELKIAIRPIYHPADSPPFLRIFDKKANDPRQAFHQVLELRFVRPDTSKQVFAKTSISVSDSLYRWLNEAVDTNNYKYFFYHSVLLHEVVHHFQPATYAKDYINWETAGIEANRSQPIEHDAHAVASYYLIKKVRPEIFTKLKEMHGNDVEIFKQRLIYTGDHIRQSTPLQ